MSSAKTVAVIIPCRNEENHIAKCLDSILSNDYDLDLLDIVVVDGMSDDQTREIVARYSKQYPCIRLLDNPQKNKPAALNLAIQATHSDVVMRIDAHADYASNYISRLVSGLDEYDADNMGGVRETSFGEGAWQQAVGIVVSHPFAAGNAIYRTGVKTSEPREVDTVFCGCYRRDVFERIGLFNPGLLRTQDREFNLRLVSHGGKIVLDPAVRCTYYPRTSLSDYAKWVSQGAFWVFYADRFTNTRMRSSRNWIPSLFVLWHLLAVATCLMAPAAFAALAVAPVALYWLTAVWFSAKEAARYRSPWLLPFLLVLFSITHYGYGIGAWAGMFAAQWQGKSQVECRPAKPSRKQAA